MDIIIFWNPHRKEVRVEYVYIYVYVYLYVYISIYPNKLQFAAYGQFVLVTLKLAKLNTNHSHAFIV